MNLDALVAHYGPLVLLFGAAIEGETVALVGGMMAHRGLMALPTAWAAVLAGTLIADQGFFLVGRTMRDRPFVARLRSTAAFRKAQARFERQPALFVLLFRFFYGLRSASPVMIGMSGFPPLRFVTLNVAAALLWSALFVGIGYVFGLGVEQVIGRAADLRDWVPYLLLLIAGAVALKFALAWWRATRKRDRLQNP